MEKKVLWVGPGLAGLVLVVAVITLFLGQQSFRGAVIDPPLPAGPIVLTDSNGQPFQLESQRGKITLVFFGYTNCPDTCPVTMAKLGQVFQELGDKSQNVQVLLVTTDPVRDSVEQLHRYVTTFNPTFLGLTGNQAELQMVWDAYGVIVLDGGETHSELVYVIDSKGNIRLTYSSEVPYQDITHDLRVLLAEK